MNRLFANCAGSLALAIATPALAQDTKTAESAETTADPARLDAAKETVDYLFPLGTYERMMKGTMDQLMDSMMSSLGNISMSDMAGAGGVSDADMPSDMKGKTLNEISREADPHFEERMQISTRVMMNEMVDLMTTMEPAIREALAKIYARKFTVAQLNEMNSFFATDTGTAFARDYMMVFVDPEMMQSMMSMVPQMMKAMPDIMEKVKDATAHLPPVKIDADRTDEDSYDAAEAAAEEAAGYDAAVDLEDPDNWSAEDRTLVEKLSADSDAAFEKYFEALEAARENTKKRLSNN